MSKQEAYQEKAEAQLRIWRAEIDKRMAQADRARAEGKIEFYARVEALNARYQAALKRLQELKGSGGDTWEEIKAGVEVALRNLREAVGSHNLH